MTFDFTRGNILHSYTLDSEGIHYRSGTQTQLHFPWKTIQRIKVVRIGTKKELQVQTVHKEKLQVWIEAHQLESFLHQFYTQWRKINPIDAVRNLSQLGQDQRKTGWLILICTLLFPGALTLMLLVDAYKTDQCFHAIQEKGVLQQAELLKESKNRRGRLMWKVRFQNTLGDWVEGKRLAPLNGLTPPIVAFVPEQKECWDFTMSPKTVSLDVNAYMVSRMFTKGFGIAFFLVTLLALCWALQKLLNKQPYVDLFQRIAKAHV